MSTVGVFSTMEDIMSAVGVSSTVGIPSFVILVPWGIS